MRRFWIAVPMLLAGCASNVDETRSEGAPLNATAIRYEVRDISWSGDSVWYPMAVTETGEVYGEGERDTCLQGYCSRYALKRDAAGVFTVLAEDFQVSTANHHGVMGGCFVTPPTTRSETTPLEAAVIHEDGSIERLPLLGDNIGNCVERISDGGTLLEYEYDANGVVTHYIHLEGQIFEANFEVAALPGPIHTTYY